MVDNAAPYSLSGFLSGYDVFLKIPELQREFVWNPFHVERLLDTIESHRIDPSLDYLFAGNMIVFQDPGVRRIRKRRVEIPYWHKMFDTAVHGTRQYMQWIQQDLTRAGHWDAADSDEVKFRKFKSRGNRIELIDGQQRMTVFTILARALEKNNFTDAARSGRLRELYRHSFGDIRIEHTSPDGNSDYNLALTHDPANNTGTDPLGGVNSVDQTGTWRTDEPLKTNLFCQSLNCILEWLNRKINSDWAGDEAGKINSFADFILDSVILIPAAVNDNEQVHLVFRYSNSYGVSLSAGELIKNDIFYFATKAGNFGAVKSRWDQIHTALSQASLSSRGVTLDDFLLIYAQSIGVMKPPGTNATKLSKKYLHQTFEHWARGRGQQGIFQMKFLTDQHTPDRARLLQFVTELKDTADAYAQMMNHTILKSKTNSEIQRTVTALVGVTTQCLPYILAIYSNMLAPLAVGSATARTNRSIFANFLRPLSAILVYRYLLRGEPIRYYRNQMYELCDKFTNTAGSRAVKLTAIKNFVLASIAADATLTTPLTGPQKLGIENALERRLLDPISENNLAKLVLLEFDGFNNNSRGPLIHPEYTSTDYELEHILPQSAKKGWAEVSMDTKTWHFEHIKDSKIIFGQKTQYNIEDYSKKIGNMIIIEKKINRAAHNKRLQGYGVKIRRLTPDTYVQDDVNVAPALMTRARPSLKTVGKLHIYRYLDMGDGVTGSRLLHVEEFENRFMHTTVALRTGTPAPVLKTQAGGLTASITSYAGGATNGSYSRVQTDCSQALAFASLDIEISGGLPTSVTAVVGSGLQAGDTIIVRGDQVGGATPAQDIIITVQPTDLVDSETGPYRWTPDDIDTRTTAIAAFAKGNANWKVW